MHIYATPAGVAESMLSISSAGTPLKCGLIQPSQRSQGHVLSIQPTVFDVFRHTGHSTHKNMPGHLCIVPVRTQLTDLQSTPSQPHVRSACAHVAALMYTTRNRSSVGQQRLAGRVWVTPFSTASDRIGVQHAHRTRHRTTHNKPSAQASTLPHSRSCDITSRQKMDNAYWTLARK
jgi:hypothetical protein